ncbi:MAG: hypothetical protein IPM56_16650 [Ignavibacteriales bacterium]|nr:MAG: hypothetical protein IPM56_16650 [Ignavibacteriales bacterium]
MNRFKLQANFYLQICLVLLLFAFFSTVSAQVSKSVSAKPDNRAIKSASIAQNFNNLKLAETAVLFSADERIQEASSLLFERLSTETSPELKALIAFALYNIGDEQGRIAVSKMAENDESEYLRRICLAILSK